MSNWTYSRGVASIKQLWLYSTLALWPCDLLGIFVGGFRLKVAAVLTLPLLLFYLPDLKLIFSRRNDLLENLRHSGIPKLAQTFFFISLFFSIIWGLTTSSLLSTTVWYTQIALCVTISVVLAAAIHSGSVNAEPLLNFVLLFFILGGFLQYFAHLFADQLIFSPQIHRGYLRLNGFTEFPNFFSLTILLLWFASYHLSTKPFFPLISFCAIFLAIQSTAKSGMVLLAAMIISLVAMAIYYRDLKKQFPKISVLFAFIAITLVAPAKTISSDFTSSFEKSDKFIEDFNIPKSSTEERLLIALQGVYVATTHPAIGVGPKAYKTYIKSMHIRSMQRFFTHHENLWLELGTELGLVYTTLFVVFLLIISWLIFPLLDLKNRGLLLGVMLYWFIGGQFVQTFFFPTCFIILGIVLGRHVKGGLNESIKT